MACRAPQRLYWKVCVGEMAPQGPATSETPGGGRGDYYCAYVQEAFSQISNLFQKVKTIQSDRARAERLKNGSGPNF